MLETQYFRRIKEICEAQIESEKKPEPLDPDSSMLDVEEVVSDFWNVRNVTEGEE